MKRVWIRVFVLFTVCVFLYAPDVVAQGHTTLHLPEGAIARLGKGDIKRITYSPNGHLIAVASSLGILWLYDADTGAEQAFLDGHTGLCRECEFQFRWCYDRYWQSGRYGAVYGISTQKQKSLNLLGIRARSVV